MENFVDFLIYIIYLSTMWKMLDLQGNRRFSISFFQLCHVVIHVIHNIHKPYGGYFRLFHFFAVYDMIKSVKSAGEKDEFGTEKCHVRQCDSGIE